MKNYNFNVSTFNIENGLNNRALMGGKYIYIDYAPTEANIVLKIDNNSNDGINLTQGKSISLPTKADNFFISCDAVVGGKITILVSDSQDFKIDDTPSFAFNESAKNSLRFAPRGATQVTIGVGTSHEFLKGGNEAIDFTATDEVSISLDDDIIKRPMYESVIALDYVNEKLVFHNDTANDIVLTYWNM
jgi:hypothetical protein